MVFQAFLHVSIIRISIIIIFICNFSGPFLLTHLLLDKLKASAPSRIINNTALAYQLASIDFEDIQAEKKEFIPGEVYGQSKLANMLFTRKLAKELEGKTYTEYQ